MPSATDTTTARITPVLRYLGGLRTRLPGPVFRGMFGRHFSTSSLRTVLAFDDAGDLIWSLFRNSLRVDC
jgi:hypothetical protein